ncbi:hypothetical protein T09_3494 [Trichinella sp. T9]|nr:hypothetical protein T09_3494 [Trichinella sp. T9]
MKLILQIGRSRRMSDVRDENKAPKTNDNNRAATENIQESLVKKKKNFSNNIADSEISLIRLLKEVKLRPRKHFKKETFENLTEDEKIMLMMKESTEAYDPKYYVKIPQRKRKSAWSSYCKRCRQKGHCIQNCPLLHYKRKDGQ